MLRQFPLGERSQQKLSSPPNQRLIRLIQQIERGRTTGQYTYTRHLIDYQLQYNTALPGLRFSTTFVCKALSIVSIFFLSFAKRYFVSKAIP